MEQVNSKSIAALTLEALSEIRTRHENGYGLAIAGRICSIVGIVLQLIILFLVFLGLSAMFM